MAMFARKKRTRTIMQLEDGFRIWGIKDGLLYDEVPAFVNGATVAAQQKKELAEFRRVYQHLANANRRRQARGGDPDSSAFRPFGETTDRKSTSSLRDPGLSKSRRRIEYLLHDVAEIFPASNR
jgi:hypothetical protein